jgi:hypothetical protein
MSESGLLKVKLHFNIDFGQATTLGHTHTYPLQKGASSLLEWRV